MAAQTSIAQVPLLNITGTGTVKPNLMLLFDNSGSMDLYVDAGLRQRHHYLPRQLHHRRADPAATIGHPPFMPVADFQQAVLQPGDALHAAGASPTAAIYAEQTAPTPPVPGRW
jgi:type IV pilus assembly protein PilY1